MNFTRENLKALRAEITAALAPIATQHGITFTLGAMRFTDADFHAKLEARGDASAPGESPYERDWKLATDGSARLAPLLRGDLGKTFKAMGKQYIIAGAKLARRQGGEDWIIAHTATSTKLYKFRVEVVLGGLGRAADAQRHAEGRSDAQENAAERRAAAAERRWEAKVS